MSASEIFRENPYAEPEIIVGEELAQAKEKGLILQGLAYDAPSKIYGHPIYILTVSIRTYNTPKQSNIPDFDGRNKLKVELVNDSRVVNAIFLDMNLNPIQVLLDKKAFIHSLEYPGERYSNSNHNIVDTLNSVITYLISDRDSNRDGVINNEDDADVYVSNCDGSQLVQVTSNWDVGTYTFIAPHEILLKYNLRSKERDEHKRQLFALYNTKTKKLKELSDLDKSLEQIELRLTK